jgi:hypothetical protein
LDSVNHGELGSIETLIREFSERRELALIRTSSGNDEAESDGIIQRTIPGHRIATEQNQKVIFRPLADNAVAASGQTNHE